VEEEPLFSPSGRTDRSESSVLRFDPRRRAVSTLSLQYCIQGFCYLCSGIVGLISSVVSTFILLQQGTSPIWTFLCVLFNFGLEPRSERSLGVLVVIQWTVLVYKRAGGEEQDRRLGPGADIRGGQAGESETKTTDAPAPYPSCMRDRHFQLCDEGSRLDTALESLGPLGGWEPAMKDSWYLHTPPSTPLV
jgi:hypothetical protein